VQELDLQAVAQHFVMVQLFEIGDTNEEIPNHFFDYCDDIFI